MNMKTIWLPLLWLSLSACAQATAEPEQAPAVVEKKQAKVLVLNQDDGKTFRWDSSQTKAELEQALAEVPADKRDKVRRVIEKMESGDSPQVLVKTLDGGDLDLDVKVITDKVVMHKLVAGEGHEFELIKKLLAKGKFSKEQLQELQKQLDGKF